ncbi:TonB family protein [Aquamicrobium segne]|uniref:TonB family protein n=1 Tax=Aquamicrobium segne TaxID=469547 RepID=A0ABW0GZ72_9HYPH
MNARPDVAWSQQVARSSASHLVLWTTAAALALGAHAGTAWWILQEPPVIPAEAGGEPAIMIDLAPVAMAPAAVEEEISPDLVESVAAEALPTPVDVEPVEPVEVAEAVPVPVETPPETEVAEPVEPDEVVPVDIAEPVEEPVEVEPVEEPLDIAEPVDPIEEMVIARLENVEVPLPIVRPAPPKPQVKKQRQKPPQKQQSAPSRDATRAQARVQQEARQVAAPQTNRGGSSVSPARWQSRLMAHLERRKRYPAEARRQRKEGVAQVRFTIDGNGNVQSVALTRSSGVAELDQEVVAMVRRASPVPAPPPGINRTIVVPVRFNVR